MKIVRNDGSCVEDERKNPYCMHYSEIKDMHKAIYGNGTPKEGLLWIAQENRAMIQSNSDFIQSIKKNASKLMWIVIVGCLSATGGLIFSIVKLIIKHQ